jgi:Cu2+-exporting ATPase
MADFGATAVIEVSGARWASSKVVTEAVLGRRPGVIRVDANPVSQTATVTYDLASTIEPLRRGPWMAAGSPAG